MNTSSPLISVVIPTHNRSGLLPRAIKSVLGQSYPHFEVIIVDDASLDGTQEVVEALGNGRLLYLRHTTNLGGSAARNTGIRAARGELVAFLDDDDGWLPQKLARQIQAALNAHHDQWPVVYTGLQYVAADGQMLRTTCPTRQGAMFSDLLYGNYIGSTSSLLAPRSCLVEVGGFDPNLQSCQDWDLLIRLARTCSYIAVADPLVRHHISSERIDTNLAAQLQGRLQLLTKIKPYLETMNRGQRRRILANHYLLLAGHYAFHGRKIEATRWITHCMTQNPLNPHAWLLLARMVGSR